MHLTSLTFLLAFLLALTNASPTPLSPATNMRTPFSSQYRHLFVRQAGCNQAQCDQCRNNAGCTAGTPAWYVSPFGLS
ncbi:unnamed protein product [Aureobasidium uvarum]|uniref:Uncharacterized protein n=1 Tax=Aureobasidium uvarum TaxID=2773716 RepID=A0A9N8KWG9_9PEZI|nr:unnamed protein product [Aureobasidium uvarum]